jgi:hypothetical protein
MADTATLTTQLRTLEQLTETEAQSARLRAAQAQTDEMRRELQQNASNADARAHEITEHLRAVGGVPDVVTPTLGRVLAFATATIEQAKPLDQALLDDLTLEHRLLDRARYVKVLADKADLREVEHLAEDLIASHSTTADRITTILADQALGGPAALRPTPVQRATAVATHAVSLPARFAAEAVNRVVDLLQRTRTGTKETDDEDADTVRQLHITSDDATHPTRTDTGTPKASELPIHHYEEMGAQGAIVAIRKLTHPEDLQAIIRFEETHKNRSGVIEAAQSRHAMLTKEPTDTT